VERCVVGGVQLWLENKRARRVRDAHRELTRRGSDVSHLPREEFNVVVDVSAVGRTEAVTLFMRDARGSQAGTRFEPVQAREVRLDLWELLEQHPEVLTRSTVHHGMHHRTGVRWGESFATLQMGRVIAHALGSSEAELVRTVLFVGSDGIARAWSHVVSDVVVASVEHHEGDEHLDDAVSAAMALMELEEFAERNEGVVVVDSPKMPEAAELLARGWVADGCSVGFHIACVATGEYGPAVSVLNAEGAVLRQLSVGRSWGEVLEGAVSKTRACLSPGAGGWLHGGNLADGLREGDADFAGG
jgi:hypothetical protein